VEWKSSNVVTSVSTGELRLMLLGATPWVAAVFIGAETPTAICNGGRPSQPLAQRTVGPAALSNGGWAVNRRILWRLRLPHSRVTSLPPFETTTTGPAAL
jgi:hypothetical protein